MATHTSILAWRMATDRGAWRAPVHGVAESDMTERLSTAQQRGEAQRGSLGRFLWAKLEWLTSPFTLFHFMLLHSNSGKTGEYSTVVCPKIRRRCFSEQLTVSATIPEEPLSFTLLSYFCTNSHRCIVMFSTIPLISVFSISSFVSCMFI